MKIEINNRLKTKIQKHKMIKTNPRKTKKNAFHNDTKMASVAKNGRPSQHHCHTSPQQIIAQTR